LDLDLMVVKPAGGPGGGPAIMRHDGSIAGLKKLGGDEGFSIPNTVSRKENTTG